MKTLKLTKGLSYSTMKVSVKKGQTASFEDDVAKRLLATGKFVEVETEAEDADGDEDEDGSEDLSAEAIEKMTKEELLALAEEKGIDLSDCSNNTERAEKIKGVLGLANMATIFSV